MHRIEIRWSGPQGPSAKSIVGRFAGMYSAANLQPDSDGGQQVVYCNHDSWRERQTMFESWLLPEIRRLGAKDPAIYIDRHPLGMWATILEERFDAVRGSLQETTAALKSTRRFFPSLRIRKIRMDAVHILRTFGAWT